MIIFVVRVTYKDGTFDDVTTAAETPDAALRDVGDWVVQASVEGLTIIEERQS